MYVMQLLSFAPPSGRNLRLPVSIFCRNLFKLIDNIRWIAASILSVRRMTVSREFNINVQVVGVREWSLLSDSHLSFEFEDEIDTNLRILKFDLGTLSASNLQAVIRRIRMLELNRSTSLKLCRLTNPRPRSPHPKLYFSNRQTSLKTTSQPSVLFEWMRTFIRSCKKR